MDSAKVIPNTQRSFYNMRKAQFNAIEKFAQDKIVKVIDETFDTPPAIIIYAQKEHGDSSILEYTVAPSGTISLVTSYSCTKAQQDFFDRATTLTEYSSPEETGE
jgi:hypothetical protein